MATSMLHYFGLGNSASLDKEEVKDTPVRALPASWYTSPGMYELERRAIFSKRWLFMTHSSRIKETGDWLRYEIAGFDFIITRDRQGKINAFHNVCRHRAYPVIEKEGSGNAKILACRYHGWSYGLDGKLAKAPGYQNLDGYEKEENGLFRIHVKVDINGFIWVNLDANEVPEVPWEEHFRDVDKQERYKAYNFDDYDLDHSYELDGHYNWKILADNFNECYHCPTTHADIPEFLNLDSFDSDLKDGHIQHHCISTPEQIAKGLYTASTYYFPVSAMVVSPHFIMIQKFHPTSANNSKMAYEIYRNRNSSDQDFKLISEMYERVMREDKVLCNNAQKNLDRNVFINGQLHPKYEKAPLFFQSAVRDAITRHFELEKSEKREIWPAKRSSSDERSSNLSATGQSHPRRLDHQVLVNPAQPTAPSLQKAIQVSRNHEGTSGWSGALPGQQLSLQTPRAGALPSAYLSVRRGGRVRYISKSFWGFVAGQESLSDDFLDENRHASLDLPPPHIAVTGLAILLRSLPTKPVCDALLHAFFIAVWPVMPLVHRVTLQAEYDEFWECCRNGDTPPAKLVDDPTFICLLFAVLLSGASAAPAAIWEPVSPKRLEKEATLNDLKAAYETSLSMSKHIEHPTYNTLVSTLLTRPFMDEPRDPMRNLVSVSTTVRIAQAMGFHSELACSDLDTVVREMRRRAWWHIVWLDVQSSISTGLPLCCGNDMQDTPAEMVGSGESVAMIYAIGRFETACLEATIITRLQSPQGVTAAVLREMATSAKKLHQKIDTLIAKISTGEILEKGSPWANASPATHPFLYRDDTSQPTVIASLTQIMLTLLKSDVLVLLKKPYLQPPDSESPQARKSWHRSYGPLQCTFLILIYLHYFQQEPDYHIARYYVDKMIHHYISRHQSPNSSLQNGGPDTSKPPMPVAVQVLVDLHGRLDLPAGNNEVPPLAFNWKPDQSRVPSTQPKTISNISVPHPRSGQPSSVTSLSATAHSESEHSTISGHTLSDASTAESASSAYSAMFDQQFLASMSDLEALSSLLVMESDELFSNCPRDDLETLNSDGS
ncbi:hypothetical protein PISL3812_03478 [Talaromyces islandicus]|uniref:Choline monooxygenase, chloroplastic n=1 Tax=Talaromyces islandicus TaxID=28573 RepID=A0A0U1LTN4_TALIS|nr:hypothetical protein PISL3812_03478 [Talaromyces islandicus]